MTKPRYLHEVEIAEVDRLSDGSLVLTFRTLDESDHTFRLSEDAFARLADDVDALRIHQTQPRTQA